MAVADRIDEPNGVGWEPRWNRRAVVFGALWWVAFAVVAVLLRGVRWEESYEFAQVLLNRIHYPAGHPTLLHCHNAFCLQTYITAAIMWLFPGPWVACGILNVLYILSGILPAYLLGTALSRKAMVGHAAAVLAFILAPAFTNAYPTQSWPIMSSSGVIGLGFALCTLCALVLDRPGIGFLMVGAMPAVHVGQFPPIAVLAGLYLADAWWRRRRDVLRRALLGCCAGLAITAVSVVIFCVVRVAPPTSGPYASNIPVKVVWQSFLSHFNFHRILHFGRDEIVLICGVVLGSVLIVREYRRGIRGPYSWLGCYTWTIALIVWGIMLIQYAMGNHVPRLVLAWLPYRLPNHLAPILLAVMAALLGANRSAPGLGLLLPPAVVCAGLGFDPAAIFFGLCGATIHAVYLTTREDKWVGLLWLLASVAGCYVVSSALGDYYALVTLGVWAVALGITRLDRVKRFRPYSKAFAPWLAGITALITAVGLVYGQWLHRGAVPGDLLARTPFEQHVISYLKQRNEPDAMIAVPPTQWRLQERLNHPVTTDAATIAWTPYLSYIGPITAKYLWNLYGIDLTRPPDQMSSLDYSLIQVYETVWKRRSVREWQRLANEYGFRYVITVTDVPLQLPVAVDGHPFRMYAIPNAPPPRRGT